MTRPGVTTFLVQHQIARTYWIVKVLELPATQTQVDALMLTGAVSTAEEAQAYYETLAKDFEAEYIALKELPAHENVSVFTDFTMVPKEEGETGYRLYFLSPCYKTLASQLATGGITWLQALNLGLDLCSGLSQLRASNLLHRNIKPTNVFFNNLGSGMLGDLGLVSTEDLRFATMESHMISGFTAPEIGDLLCEFSPTVDIYSVGMILYRIFNGNHGPFEDENTSAKLAERQRLEGTELPVPLYADYELAEIILKACAHNPADRYQTPDEMTMALVAYMQMNSVSDQVIVPPLVVDDDILLPADMEEETIEPVRFADTSSLDTHFVDNFSPDEAKRKDSIQQVEEHERKAAQKPKKKKSSALAILLTLLFLIGGGATAFYFFVMGGPPVEVSSFTLVSKNIDSIQVDAEFASKAPTAEITCTDSYGNTTRIPFAPGGTVIGNLEPGAQYTLSLESTTATKLVGETKLTATTNPITEILSFTAHAPAVGQAQLDFVVSGSGPETWTISYAADGEEAQTMECDGKSALVFGLISGKTYTFTLEPPENSAIKGATSTTLKVGPEITISNLETTALSLTDATLEWDSDYPLPDGELWNIAVKCTDGTAKSLTSNTKGITLPYLEVGETYTVTVSSPSTPQPATLAFTPTVVTASSFIATATGDGTVGVSWESDVPDTTWKIRYAPAHSSVYKTQDFDTNSGKLTNLIPGISYELELLTGANQKVSGESTATVVTLLTDGFSGYGTESFFTATYLKPTSETWNRGDLSTKQDQFTEGQNMVFAVETLAGWEESEDMIDVSMVISDDVKLPVFHQTETVAWNELWDGNVFLGDVEALPSTPGNYTISLYFNAHLVKSQAFTIA